MMRRVEIIERYLSSPLAVLALWQPHATLCVAPDPEHDGQPGKEHEARHWYPYEKLPFCVAIHAAKKYDPDNRDYFIAPRFRQALKRCGYYPGDPRPLLAGKASFPNMRPTPLGAIIGLATVVEVSSAQTPPQKALEAGVTRLDLDALSADDRAFGFFVVTNPNDPHQIRYAWRLADTIELPEPVRHTGRQEPLYPLDVTTLDLIHAQLRGMVAP